MTESPLASAPPLEAQSVAELLATLARCCPDAPALIAPGRAPLTFEALWTHVTATVQALRAHGVHRQDRVAVLLPDGPELATALLAVAAGASAAPFHPGTPAPELGSALAALPARVLLVAGGPEAPAVPDTLPADLTVLTVVARPDAPAGAFALEGLKPALAEAPGFAMPEDCALVLHTSGTTARPKRVPLTHANLCHSAHTIATWLALTPADRCLNVMPLFHIHGLVGALLASLAAGASVVCPPGGFAAPQFFPWLAEFRPTWYTAVPALHHAILGRAPGHRDVIARHPLRFIRSASAPLPSGLLDALEATFQAPVLEAYGMTEAAHQIASNPLPPRPRKPSSVGVPTGTGVVILDEGGRSLPPGETGEIAIRGPAVTAGYEGLAEPTGSPTPGDWLRTGDLGFLDPDGYLFLTGRIKDLINRGGEKIAPREVEEALLAHPAVAEAVAFPVAHWQLGEDVAAAVVLRTRAASTAPALRSFLAGRLAPFKIPRQLVLVNALPTSTTGKLSRSTFGRQLGVSTPAPERTSASSDPRPPRTPLEGDLAALWREVLGVDHVGPDDDFFALGGDSLLATQLAARARASLRLDLSLLGLFETPTLAGLAGALESAPSRRDLTAPRAVRREQAAPMSSSQERVWFLAQLEPESPGYHRPVTLRLRGALDVDALGQSLGEIVRRHEVLRAFFAAVDGRPVQHIAAPEPGPLPVVLVDLRDRPASGRKGEARHWIREELRQPFDLARGPVLRAALLRLDIEDHVLHLTFHHIVFDGWSEAVLRRELAALYPACAQGRPSPLPELPLQYPDVVAWHEGALRDEALASDLGYWRERLGGPLPVLQLPTDHPRSSTETHRGAHHAVTLSRELTEALHALSRQRGATLFMTLLAGFQTLLHRYTDQDDLLVGVPVAGRLDLETEALIGIFINTLVFRADVGDDPPFAAHLARVRERALEAYAHQALPFDRLVRALQPARRRSQNPLFQVLFQLRNVPRESPPIPGLSVEPFPVESGSVLFDLALDVAEEDGVLRCVFEYRTDLFDPATIERMGGHFRGLLEGAAAAPDQRLSRLPLLTDGERRDVLSTWNATAAPFPSDERLHPMVEAQAERTPDAVAVADDAQELTYRQLNRRANQLAHRLRKLGVGPDTPVAVCMERSTETIAALLAVLKAGGAYLPLAPTLPRERLAMMLDDSRAPVLLTQERLAPRLPASRAAVVFVDASGLGLDGESPENPDAPVTADHLAYLIYTSGSTGTPKAVMVPHRAISNHLRWRHAAFPMGEADRFLQKAPLEFDISVWEIFAPLSAGARSVLARPRCEMDPGYLVRVIAEERVTIAHFGPAMLQAFLEAAGVERCRSLRRVFCGGEPLPPAMMERFFARLGGALIHQYGPTEACVDSTVWPCRPGDRSHVLPIGRPIANTRVYVLDRHLQPVPVGVPGELHIGGAGLARGYLGRPALTAERFIPDPFVDHPGARLYKTGDLARHRADGNLEFLGRLDHQVKLRGFRIELGEVEAVLARHPAVREAVVALREDRPGDGRLVAYLVSREDPPPSIRELRGFLADTLPAYMVPAAFVPLATMPRTPNGKVDRRALPPPADSRLGLDGRFVAPRTAVEGRLAAIWCESLGVARVGCHDDFFELGGHSLLATQIVSRIRSALGLDLPVRALFDAPTVAGLAALVEEQAVSRTEPEELDRIMAEVEQLSDDEVQARLTDGPSEPPVRGGA